LKYKTFPPLNIQEALWAGAKIHILASALEFKVFNAIEEGAHRIEEIASKIGASPKGSRILLDALTGMKLLEKRDSKYFLTPESETFLVGGEDTYIGDFLLLHKQNHLEVWPQLSKAVKQGSGVREFKSEEEAASFFACLVRGLFVLNYPLGKELAKILRIAREKKPLRLIDIAAGSAPWSIALAEANPDLEIVLQDFPPVIEVAKEYVRGHGLGKQFKYLPGDLREVDFGKERYDLAILGNICHSQGVEGTKKLFKKVCHSLKSKGKIIVIDTLPNEERTGPVFPLIFTAEIRVLCVLRLEVCL